MLIVVVDEFLDRVGCIQRVGHCASDGAELISQERCFCCDPPARRRIYAERKHPRSERLLSPPTKAKSRLEGQGNRKEEAARSVMEPDLKIDAHGGGEASIG
jgi:hypothetical protein